MISDPLYLLTQMHTCLHARRFGISFNKVTSFLGLISNMLLWKNSILLKYLSRKFNLAALFCSGSEEAQGLSLDVHVRNILAYDCCAHEM